MWKKKDEPSNVDKVSYGRRAANAMDVPRVLDRTLEMIFSSTQDPDARSAVTKLRLKAQEHKDEFLNRVAEIYASVYAFEDLTALVTFLESPAGRAMREKQSEVEQQIKRATTEFLQGLVKQNS